MARQRPKQLEPIKIGPSKLGFDGEEDGWIFVKKQRVIIVLPSLPLPEPFTAEKPATSQSQSELRDFVADTQETTHVHAVVPSLPLPEQFILQKPATFQSQAELKDVIADIHQTAPAHTMAPSLPPPEHFILQKSATSQSQAELRDVIADMHETTPLPPPEHFIRQKPETSKLQVELRANRHQKSLVHTMVPSLPVAEQIQIAVKKPATSQSQTGLRVETPKATLFHTVVPFLPVTEHRTLQKPATSQSHAESRSETRKATLVHTVKPSLPVLEYCTSQKATTSQLQAEPRDFVADAHETTGFHAVEPEACPDFTSVDKPEIVTGRDLTTRKAPGPRRSLQDCRMDPERRLAIQRSRTGYKPTMRFPKVMCSSVVMDNEKLRVVNLEKKVEKAGGLNEWVGSIGLGREFERMLRGQRMSKFQMANLTMEKLKHMGALAVGPRRKLIHAIRCVYHPHCLRASFN
ncbi:hypothetical protein EUTSA_v10020684mg [Eutrema salsugineum]|uniref:SAM domain-containing protein n=1 Tax=Eutrema salsugineum TaxID=72664 RepID=V4LEF3_EUTSA|nr:uncharacterized protein LOC18023321 [Eutrema salsugineum]XP_024015802.1 uncharacterized protein LOC18023321 [Eutrema salsugineum]XP_024015803.1 uncharacterized protein LOC18023321 [Eutrema salsugineum]ESQ48855.1 hypothetical protein EUTSA_v10020684mg [Eutrema salsugineum]